MSAHHLAKGSQLPPFTGKLRVYSMRYCPYAQRAILVLNAKGVPYETVNINLVSKPEWLTSKSPLGKVPALEVEENVTIYESLVTAEYVDDKYPEPKLVSSDPLRKAQDKLIVENFGRVTTSYYKALFAKTTEIEDDVIEIFFTGLEDLQDTLVERSTKFLAGDKPGMVDYMVWPWFERIELVPKISSEKFTMDKTKFKVLFEWMEQMKQDPAVMSHFLDQETHYKFFLGVRSGNPDYDILLN